MDQFTIQHLLFLTYLTSNNQRLLNQCIKDPQLDPSAPEFQKAAGAGSVYEMNKKILWAQGQASAAMAYLQEQQVQVIPYNLEQYPQSLLAIKNFPPLIYVKGSVPSLPNMAIVGTRKPSPLAMDKITTMVNMANEGGLGIVSGLALGIDTIAHTAALQAKLYTAAILPVSLDKVYPPENSELAQAILDQGGCLLSEQPPFFEPVVNPFVMRNRLQSALSDFIIPVEMGIHSGTRYTIQFAVQQGKKVILCKPSALEIDHYLSQYEGILTTMAKYKTKRDQVILIKDLNSLQQLLYIKEHCSQASLF